MMASKCYDPVMVGLFSCCCLFFYIVMETPLFKQCDESCSNSTTDIILASYRALASMHENAGEGAAIAPGCRAASGRAPPAVLVVCGDGRGVTPFRPPAGLRVPALRPGVGAAAPVRAAWARPAPTGPELNRNCDSQKSDRPGGTSGGHESS